MEICSKCCRETYIENRTRMLCTDCNFLRRKGVTKQSYEAMKAIEYQKRSQEKQSKKPVKQAKSYTFKVTDKQKTTKEELNKLKERIRQKARDEDMYYCWGCGDGSQSLDCSHILSVKQRKDLELVEENINLFCREKCHMGWESGDPKRIVVLQTFEKDFHYLFVNDSEKFWKLYFKIEEWVKGLEEKPMNIVVILNKYKK